jgi:hypothetical protein
MKLRLWYIVLALAGGALMSGNGTVVVTGARTESFSTQAATLERESVWEAPEGTHTITLPYPTNPMGLMLTSSVFPGPGVYTIGEGPILTCNKADPIAHGDHTMTAEFDYGRGGVIGAMAIGHSGTVTLQRVGVSGLDGTADIDMCHFGGGEPSIHVHATFSLR